MGYVYEKISDVDRLSYKLETVNKRHFAGFGNTQYWVIDRDRDYYLILARRGREESGNESTWYFSRKGSPAVVEASIVDYQTDIGGHHSATYSIQSIKIEVRDIPDVQLVIEEFRSAINGYWLENGGPKVKSMSTALTNSKTCEIGLL
ncbi:MAG: hypothetical protein AB8C02_15565 [Halioglobus sp.]